MEVKPPPELSLEGDLTGNWRRWKNQFDLYVFEIARQADNIMDHLGSGMNSTTFRKSLLLRYLGPKALEIYNQFTWAANEDRDKISVIYSKFTSYFSHLKGSGQNDDTPEKEAMGDLSQLPEVVLVQVMSHLPLSDRGKVALTCRSLSGVFHHPSLWRNANIFLYHGQFRFNDIRISSLESFCDIIKQFGGYFQDLTLEFSGQPDKIADLLKELNQQNRLESLTLKVGVGASKFNFRSGSKVPRYDLSQFAALVSNAFRLRSFTLESWPSMQQFQTVDILDVLSNNIKLKNLEKLCICHMKGADTTSWALPKSSLPSVEKVEQAIQNFTCLTTLKVHFSLVSPNLISILAETGRPRMKRLCFIVTYSSEERNGGLPQIYSSDWSRLSQHSPEIKVEFTFVNRIPSVDLADVLKAEISVTAVYFMKYSRCRLVDLESITDKFSKSLEKYINYTDGEDDLDEAHFKMVSRSPRLNYFVYHGQIHYTTVLRLAELHRTRWRQFEIKAATTVTSEPLDRNYDNLVVGKNDSGECFLVRNMRELAETEEERDTHLKDLIEEVSGILERMWNPFVE